MAKEKKKKDVKKDDKTIGTVGNIKKGWVNEDAPDPSLKDQAIKIKGNEYVKVADRIKYFNKFYPKGRIVTIEQTREGLATHIITSGQLGDFIQNELLNFDMLKGEAKFKAIVHPNIEEYPKIFFTGTAKETSSSNSMVNKYSAIENAETSAVGRALGMMGIGVINEVASADEVNSQDRKEKASNIDRAKDFIDQASTVEEAEDIIGMIDKSDKYGDEEKKALKKMAEEKKRFLEKTKKDE